MTRTLLPNAGLSAHCPRRYREEPKADIDVHRARIDVLEEWVGTDGARAQVVIDEENTKAESDRRSRLLKKMQDVIDGDLI